MPIAYSYQRFSSPQQADSNSLDRQRKFFDRICRRYKLTKAKSYTFVDHAKSGSKGRNQRDLERFKQLVEDSTILPGSWLVVENLDRFSRRGFEDTFELLQYVLKRDITIVTGEQDEPLTRKSLNKTIEIIKIAISSERAWQESHHKSVRCSAAWQDNLRNAAKEKVTKKGPAWLTYVKETDSFVKNEERTKIIGEIYNLAIKRGMGQRAIAKYLNDKYEDGNDKYKPWQTGKHNGKRWSSSYVQLILTSRTVLGEFTTNRNKKKEEPNDTDEYRIEKPQTVIKGYYPAAVDTTTFNKAQAIIGRRTKFRGKTSKQVACLLSGLARDSEDRRIIYIKNNAKYNARWAAEGTDKGERVSFPYEPWEKAFLHFTKELTPKDIGKDKPREKGEIDELSERITEKEIRIAAIENDIKEGDDDQRRIAMGIVGDVSRELQQLIAKRDNLIAQQHMRSSGDLLAASQTLSEQMERAKGEDRIALRMELRQAIRELIDGMKVKIWRQGSHTYMTVEITYRSGEIRRMVLLSVSRVGVVAVADSEKWKKKMPKQVAMIFGKERIANLGELESMLAGHNVAIEYDSKQKENVYA